MANTTDRYRVDTSNPAIRLEERLRQLERQVSDVHRSRNIRAAAMRGGMIRMIDDNGDEYARIGQGAWSGPGGASFEHQLRFHDTAGNVRFLVGAESGMVWPPTRAPWYPVLAPTGTFVPVTSGSFVSTYRVIYTQAADAVRARFTIGVDAGTTGEVRLESGGPHQTAVVPLPAGTLADYHFNWHLGSDGLGITLGTDLSIDVQVRRTGGAGAINVHQPAPLMVTDHRMLEATVTGLP